MDYALLLPRLYSYFGLKIFEFDLLDMMDGSFLRAHPGPPPPYIRFLFCFIPATPLGATVPD